MTEKSTIRPRVSGICVIDNRLLLLKHEPGFRMPYFWLPPGGGVEVGETLAAALQREFLEETGLMIEVDRLLCTNEFIHLPVHALEFFFLVRATGGNLQKGHDPEFAANAQMIAEVKLMTFEEIKAIPPLYLHNIFWNCQSLDQLLNLQGHFQLIR